ncbi:MAG TPA: septum site-determining protein MinD [Candidatus Melainabacteria bacterium]|jgi:septum site-determining protein MinD|nr:septum site-determining protein MinD [Candidatus Obscuribacterales bacterium]HIA53914.1 septum site-determining protein MinD [Candidatus Melainabacteria bacterium]HIN65271.1 septum site-determining protein MinD [Candidatus Obscuribacterales bacterium]
MSGRVIVITSGKGGVGKTTASANIGVALANTGASVCLVDMDIGLRNLDILMGLENRVVYNLVDVVEERCKLRQALVKDKRMPNLNLLPAAQTRDKTAVDADQMKKLCEELKSMFDFVLIDSPAGIESGFQNAIAGAEEAIVITTPEMSAVRDADRIIGLLEARKDEITQYRLVLNRLRPKMVANADMMGVDDVLEILSIKLLGVVPEDEDIIISTNKGEPVSGTDNTRSGLAFRNIARRLRGEEVPFMDLEAKNDTWVTKIVNFFNPVRV